MFDVPTTAAHEWNGARFVNIGRLHCQLPALSAEAAVLHVTRSGVLLKTSETLRVGSSHFGAFKIDGRTFEFPLRVVHSHFHPDGLQQTSREIGLAFQVKSGRDRAQLETLMTLLAGGAAPGQRVHRVRSRETSADLERHDAA